MRSILQIPQLNSFIQMQYILKDIACTYHTVCIRYLASGIWSMNSRFNKYLLLLASEMEQVNIQQYVTKFIVSKRVSFMHLSSWAVTCTFKDDTLSWCKVLWCFTYFWEDRKYVLDNDRNNTVVKLSLIQKWPCWSLCILIRQKYITHLWKQLCSLSISEKCLPDVCPPPPKKKHTRKKDMDPNNY